MSVKQPNRAASALINKARSNVYGKFVSRFDCQGSETYSVKQMFVQEFCAQTIFSSTNQN